LVRTVALAAAKLARSQCQCRGSEAVRVLSLLQVQQPSMIGGDALVAYAHDLALELGVNLTCLVESETIQPTARFREGILVRVGVLVEPWLWSWACAVTVKQHHVEAPAVAQDSK
jgi:hypothetical protein